jgi:hypothetical protein
MGGINDNNLLGIFLIRPLKGADPLAEERSYPSFLVLKLPTLFSLVYHLPPTQ